jgi:4-amino-4-deoxy-L-arabinose transferase-like glycosyltransferase
VFFILLYVEQSIDLWKDRVNPNRFSLLSGVYFGAALLSRQWGILILPALFFFATLLLRIQNERRRQLFKAFTLSGVIAFLISGWFYISLLVRFGSLTAFNREPTEQFSLKNKARSFYIGSGNGQLFSDPVRDSFDNQLIPIFYTETWGDYWQYYLVNGKDMRTEKTIQGDYLYKALQEVPLPTWLHTNRDEIAPYLGRVNLISIILSGITLLGFGWGLLISIDYLIHHERYPDLLHIPLFTSIILSTLIGYLWFLIQYPSPDGDTIKSTYVLQIFPFAALLVGQFGARISASRPWSYPVTLGLILLTFLHNLGSVITRYF